MARDWTKQKSSAVHLIKTKAYKESAEFLD